MIPNGWRRSVVRDACAIKNNLRLPLSTEVRVTMSGPYPYFGPTGVLGYIDHFRIDEEFALIGEDGDHFLKFRDKPMTLLFKGKANVNNHAHIIGDSNDCSARWFYYWFMHRDLTAVLSRQGVARYKLTKAGLEGLEICLPPKAEQARIVQVLSAWNEAIVTSEQLLANCRKQKQALVERLTNGKKYLDEWSEFSLGELGVPFSGLSGKEGSDFGAGSPYINVYKNHRIDINALGLVKVVEGESQNRVLRGDILFTTSSETPNEVGMASVLQDDLADLFLNSFCFGYRLHNFNTLLPEYAGYLLRNQRTRIQFTKIAQGSTRYNIGKNQTMRIKVRIPPLDEQKRIVSVLNQATGAVEVALQQIEKLRVEKSALLQQLLTGKRRVQVPKQAEAALI